MPYRTVPLVTGEFYHIYNRGLEKQTVFSNKRDHAFFMQALSYYQIENPKPKFSLYKVSKVFPVDQTKKMVDVICYCLMPNHFHLLLRQVRDNGISELLRKFIHSYTNYRNLKYNRQGPVFQGMFKAVRVESDEQLTHVSRYIHLNPLVANLVSKQNFSFYPWSSYPVYLDLVKNENIAKDEILYFFKNPKDYEKFVLDQADYGMQLEQIKHLILDVDDH